MEKDDDVEVISTQDKRAKIIGEILSNDTSRNILNILKDEEFTLNEIAQKTDTSLSLATHHIKKMQSVQAVKIARVGRSVKGHKMNYYTATDQSFLIVPTKTETITSSIKKFSRFFAIGLAGLVSWMTLRPRTEFSEVQSQRGAAQLDTDANFEVIIEDHSDTVASTERANTGSVSLDRTVYPVPHDESAKPGAPVVEPEPATEWQSAQSDSDVSLSGEPVSGTPSLELYPRPVVMEAQSADAIDPVVFSIIIPIAVVGVGILIERVLNRWYTRRRG